MARIEKPRQILTEDFKEELKDTIELLADIINPALESLYIVTNNGIDFNNLAWGVVSGLIVQVKDDGSPDTTTGAIRVTNKFKNTAKKNPIGIQVISATCLDDASVLTTGTPFIQYSLLDNNLIEIKNIQGIPAGKRFQLTLVLITN